MWVEVKRRCMENREWTAVDFSSCTLSSSDQQVIVILSLWTIITIDSDGLHEVGSDIQSLEDLVYEYSYLLVVELG